MTGDLQRLKGENNKKEKALNKAGKEIEQLKCSKQQMEKLMRLAQTLKEQNGLLMNEIQL